VAVALGGGHLRFQLSVARQQLLDLLVLLLDQGLQFGDSVFHAHASMLHRCTSPPDLLRHFIPCGVWEAIYILDGLLKNTSEMHADEVTGDTQAQSTVVFGLAHLLGIRLMPRIRPPWTKEERAARGMTPFWTRVVIRMGELLLWDGAEVQARLGTESVVNLRILMAISIPTATGSPPFGTR
jgi:hypothetical protein